MPESSRGVIVRRMPSVSAIAELRSLPTANALSIRVGT